MLVLNPAVSTKLHDEEPLKRFALLRVAEDVDPYRASEKSNGSTNPRMHGLNLSRNIKKIYFRREDDGELASLQSATQGKHFYIPTAKLI